VSDGGGRTADERAAALGVAAATAAFVMWGVLPFYWKAVDHVSVYEIAAHRVVWTLVLAGLLLTITRRWGELACDLRCPSGLALTVVRGALLIGNWLVFIWAVNEGRILECSLGYFINPLVSVLLGRLVLGEELRRAQIVAIALAAGGVAVMFAQDPSFPWVALVLAGTFASYGLLRKTSRVESLPGLVGETAAAFVPAAVYLAWLEAASGGVFIRAGARTSALLIGGGAVTAVPLLLFAYGARRIALSTVGFLQYLGPSVMFAIGVLAYAEPLKGRLPTFALIWAALAVFAWDGIMTRRRRVREAREADGAPSAGTPAGATTAPPPRS
jgi:chloramphenicol-sensitive protein RarD